MICLRAVPHSICAFWSTAWQQSYNIDYLTSNPKITYLFVKLHYSFSGLGLLEKNYFTKCLRAVPHSTCAFWKHWLSAIIQYWLPHLQSQNYLFVCKITLQFQWPRSPSEKLLRDVFEGSATQYLCIQEALSDSNHTILIISPPVPKLLICL